MFRLITLACVLILFKENKILLLLLFLFMSLEECRFKRMSSKSNYNIIIAFKGVAFSTYLKRKEKEDYSFIKI